VEWESEIQSPQDSNMASPTRSLNTFGENQDGEQTPSEDSRERQGAALLLSVAAIVAKEIGSDGVNWDDDEQSAFPVLPSMDSPADFVASRLRLRCSQTSEPSPMSTDEDEEQDDRYEWQRVRSVSIDVGDETPEEGEPEEIPSSAPIVSPLSSPVTRRQPLRKSTLRAMNRNKQRSCRSTPATTTSATSPSNSKRALQPQGILKVSNVKTILRKKFSWKNYPEVRHHVRVPSRNCIAHILACSA